MTRPIRPRRLVHRGWVEARGLVFSPARLGAIEARRRVVAAWVPGSRVVETRTGLWLIWREPRRVDAAAVPGAPAVERDGRLATAPLDAAEWVALDPSPHAWIDVVAGRAERLAEADQSAVDPAIWIDLDAYESVDVTTLGAMPEPLPAPPKVPSNVFADAIGPVDRRIVEVVEALRGDLIRRGEQARREDSDGTDARPTWGERLAAAWVRWHTRGTGGPATGPSPAPGALGRAWRAISGWFARRLWASHLGARVARRHADYLAELLSLFDRGRFDEALRRALPLDGDPADGAAPPPALSPPIPRTSLEISPSRAPADSTVGLGSALMSALRHRYAAAFEQLDAQGRLDEAAFVLAELLGDTARAVAYLERHGRHRLAAELASARNLDPGLVVRQWWLAGDRERAVRHARRHGAFADAVGRLEADDPGAAQALRLLWADALGTAGDFVRAIQIAWCVPEAHGLVRRWIALAIEIGGPMRARALLRKASLSDAEFDEAFPTLRALVGAEPPDTELAHAVARDVESMPSGPRRARLAELAVRGLLASGETVAPAMLHRLLQITEDTALKYEVSVAPPAPPAPRAPALARATSPRQLSFPDVGTLDLRDAARLPDGGWLVAAGEAGVRLLWPDGRQRARFDEPAHNLVVSDHGTRALLLARRGEAHRIARLDLIERRTEPWTELGMTAWADTYDGERWLVATTPDLRLLDAVATRPESLWRLPRIGLIFDIARLPGTAVWTATGEPAEVEGWCAGLPDLRVKHRFPLPGAARFEGGRIGGSTAVGWAHLDGEDIACTVLRADGTVAEVRLPPGPITGLDGAWLFRRRDAAHDHRATFYEVASGQCRLVVDLPGARRARVRFQTDEIVLFDDLGRLVALDARTGEIRARALV